MALASQENNAAILPPVLKSKKIAVAFQDHLRTVLEEAMASIDAYKIVDWENTDYLIKEYQKEIQRGTLLDRSLIVSIGKALGANIILMSELQLLKDNKISVNCYLINISVSVVTERNNSAFQYGVGPFIRAAEIVAESDENAFKADCAALVKKMNIEPIAPIRSFKPIEILDRPFMSPYPPQAYRFGIQGMVKLEVIVGDNGSPHMVRAIEGPKELKSHAIEYVKGWKFKPAIINDQPIMSFYYVIMPYKL
jgi:TonB family protein